MKTLEAAARAAYARYNADGPVPGNWDKADPEEHQDFFNVAHAVLSAALDADEVTEPMQNAVNAAGEQIPAGLPEAWRAGILAILGERQ